jgi:uncharacterized membrane protein
MSQEDSSRPLLQRMEQLVEKQAQLEKEIREMRSEIQAFQQKQAPPVPKAVPQPEELEKDRTLSVDQLSELYHLVEAPSPPSPPNPPSPQAPPPAWKSDLEKFIGENLFNKIGVLILVIGVGIGAKYAVDHNMVSPVLRILFGYMAGLGLLGGALKLKKAYENFSAVLLSGAMAIFYFITYLAYAQYQLIPQSMAFGMMVMFTGFTVMAAVKYARQIIAHLGLVGAYAIPFLLSNDTGNAAVLFSYMALINGGVLVLAFVHYWKPLAYTSFGFTWLIFLSWFNTAYVQEDHLLLGLNFAVVFFVLFYTSFLAYKLRKLEAFLGGDIVLILANSFLFFAVGYSILNDHVIGGQLLGLFALANALVHFGVGMVIHRQKLADRNLYYLVVGLVLVFVTIAIPIQWDGNWVTLLWAGQSVLLFWIGRSRQVWFYEAGSYVLMVLTAGSLLHDWEVYGRYFEPGPGYISPLWNVHLLTGLAVAGAFAGIWRMMGQWAANPFFARANFPRVVNVAVAVTTLGVVYVAFRLEIYQYFLQQYYDTRVTLSEEEYLRYAYNLDLKYFRIIWILLYTIGFLGIVAWAQKRWMPSVTLGWVLWGLQGFALLLFLTQGLYALSQLREIWLRIPADEYFMHGPFSIGIRYLALGVVGYFMYYAYRLLREGITLESRKPMADLFLHLCALWVISSELIHWLDWSGFHNTYKLGLSVLWGVYSLAMVALGIWKNNRAVRIAAMALFAITLAKLFFYDIAHLGTIAKTVVFVSLGLLLLIISFLYNKFKHLIINE